MIRSMTGFARALGHQKKGGWTVEIRSLNHRHFEFSLRVPPALYGLEDRIREFCQGRVRRGKVTVAVTESETNGLTDLALDEKVLGFYLSSIRKVQKKFRLKGEPAIGDLLALPKIFSVEKKSETPETVWRSLKPLLDTALGRLTQSRVREGKVLLQDILDRIQKIQMAAVEVEDRAKSLPKEHYERLKKRIAGLLDEKVTPDERVWQEAAFLAERGDITEELVRLKSHLDLFREKAARGDEVGKELDFLLQEMNREVNTLSAKAQDFGVSREVVSMKAELEKIREQIQNIE